MKLFRISNTLTQFFEKKSAWVFMAPFLSFYFVTGVFPLLYSLYISFFKWNGYSDMEFVGFSNYVNLFINDPLFWKSIGNTIIISVFVIPLSMALGLLLAMALHSSYLAAKKVFQVINFLPYITAPVAVGIIFALMFSYTNGIVNNSLLELGIADEGVNWLGYSLNARIVVIILGIWKSTGYQMIFFLAGLATIPKELYEAAEVMGANIIQRFRSITLPMLSGVISFLTLVNIINGLQLIQEPMLLFSSWASGSPQLGGPERSVLTTIWYMYDTTFAIPFKYGKGAAISYSLFIIIAFLIILVRRIIPSIISKVRGR